jgi:hypothetical protein
MELNVEDMSLSPRESPVESLGHCQPVGIWMFFPRGFMAIAMAGLTYPNTTAKAITMTTRTQRFARTPSCAGKVL